MQIISIYSERLGMEIEYEVEDDIAELIVGMFDRIVELMNEDYVEPHEQSVFPN